MRRLNILLVAFGVLITSAVSAAGLKTVALAGVKANKSVEVAAERAGKALSMTRMLEAMDGQLMDALQNTRKFEIIARSDAEVLIEEAVATGRAFDFGEADYLVVVTVDDFQDVMQTATFASIGKTVEKRVIRFSVVAKIYDAKTNALIESASFQEQLMDADQTSNNIQTEGDQKLTDSLLVGLTRSIAEKVANRVSDIAYPARILAKTGKIVTINRGDGSDIQVGELWEAFALGEALIDPDTGVSLGQEEVSMGTVRIIRVTPKTSQAEIVDDFGIEKLGVVRKVAQ